MEKDSDIVFDGDMPLIKLDTEVRMFDVTFFYFSDKEEEHYYDLMDELKEWFGDNGWDKTNFRRK